MNANTIPSPKVKPTKIVLIGGNGLIGSKLTDILRKDGHHVVAASRSTGVNVLTGEGLVEVLESAHTVVDVTNSPSFEADAVMDFFQTSGRHLLGAAKSAGVQHYIALSVVGTDRFAVNGYFRAKLAQEQIIKDSGLPYTIVRATQFFEFTGAIAYGGTQGDAVHLPPVQMQPIASDDVAMALRDAVQSDPINGIVDIAGPDIIHMDALVRQFLSAMGDPRTVVTDPQAGYFGSPVEERSLVPIGANPRIAPTHFTGYLAKAFPTK